MSQVVHSPSETHELAMGARSGGNVVGVVMTMGALHEGHLSLVRTAVDQCDFVLVTIFVNPSQFGPNEDFDAYPRNLDGDMELLSELNVDLIFAPEVSAIYEAEHSTMVQPPRVALPLEGIHRPGHFQGVCTVVLKLLNIVIPHRAFFGQKDYQQYLVIRDMVRDLNVPTQVIACPTCRESDGLAMSSRNIYLSPEDRQIARAIPEALNLSEQLIREGEHDIDTIEAQMGERLSHDRISLDYAAIVDIDTLQPQRFIDGPVLAAVAAKVGSTRLIDNRMIA